MKETKTKDQQAQEYTKQIQKDFIHNRLVTEELAFKDIEAAWLAGYTACEQSMWRSVEEELPSNDDKVFVIIRGAYVCGWYNHKYELWEIFGMGSYNRKDASYWMPIPPIHDTNTNNMTAEELTDFTIEQFNAIAEKKLTVQQTAKVLVSMVRIMTIQFPTDELKQRFLAEFADEILSLSPKNGHYCTLGNSGRVVTIEEGFNENGKFYERASVAGKSLRPCNADDCPLKQNDL